MRKFIKIAAAVLFVSIFALAFAACKNPDNPDNPNPNNGIEDNNNGSNNGNNNTDTNAIFTFFENTVTGLTEYGATLTKITIPEKILSNNITAIADDAFIHNQTVTEVIIPNSVTKIGHYAFFGCTSLTSITLPFIGARLNVTIHNQYFGWIFGAYASSNQNIFIPPSLKTVIITGSNRIEDYAFEGCTGLETIEITDSVTEIGEAFRDCTGLTSITIPNSVTYIGTRAFFGCTSLTNVIFESGSNLLEIGIAAFANCTGLTSITIPHSVTSIESQVFRGCRGLTSITIPHSVTRISNSAFLDCTNLTDIYVQGHTSRPSGWNSNWNGTSATVHWGQ
ncbi:MAG: leucine-rich repeat domain-containing protein [Firmicutes bacterium]|nr:leucine-rich repeat domain-containing protein [Bacillota bacterium]